MPQHAPPPGAPARAAVSPRASRAALARQRRRAAIASKPSVARSPERRRRPDNLLRATLATLAAIPLVLGGLGSAGEVVAQGEESPTPTTRPTPKPTPKPTPRPTPWPTPKGVKGLDVSHWNGYPDFDRLRNAGMRFVFSKATQGTSFVDDTFRRHTREARDAGLLAGAYHFFDYRKGGKAQARHFLSTVRSTTGLSALLPLVVDVETLSSLGTPNKTRARQRLHGLIDELYAQTGRYPMIYTSQYMWNKVVGSPTSFGRYKLWVACWKCDKVHMPAGWSNWHFWQVGQFRFDWGPRLDGNLWRSTMDALKQQKQRPMRLARGTEWSTTRTVESDLRGFNGSQVRYAIGQGAWSGWKPYAGRFALQLGTKQGKQDVKVQLRSFRSVKSPVLKDSIKLDSVAPTIWGPRVSLRQDVRIQKTAARVPTVVDMGARDTTSGLRNTTVRVDCRGAVRAKQTRQTASHGLNVQIDRGGCTLVSLARDKAGNQRIRKLEPRTTVIDLKRSNAKAEIGSAWTILSASEAVGRSLARTSTRNATIKVAIDGAQVGIVARRGPSGGRFRVSVDGKHVGTVDLYSASGDARRVVYVANVPKGKHTLKLQATGTKRAASKGTSVWLDAVLVLDRRK